jgi:hypothetical protein
VLLQEVLYLLARKSNKNIDKRQPSRQKVIMKKPLSLCAIDEGAGYTSQEDCMEDDKVSIHIPSSLFARLTTHVDDMGYDSVEEFVTILIEEALIGPSPSLDPGIASGETEEIRRRLRNLGYFE